MIQLHTGHAPVDILAGLDIQQAATPAGSTAQAAPQVVAGSTEQPDFAASVELTAKWLSILHDDPQSVVELRALKYRKGHGKPHTQSGVYDSDHRYEMAWRAHTLSRNSPGVYFTLNPVNRDWLSKRGNRVDFSGPGDTVSDRDITARRLLLIDVDPKRLADVSSTNEEKSAAWALVENIRDFLAARCFPDPILADSANGFHLLYRIDLPVDDGGIVERCLRALDAKFSTSAVAVDTSVYNASRIVKVYGTWGRKGDSTPDRPWRQSKILTIPETFNSQPVPREMLDALAAESPTTTSKSASLAAAMSLESFGPASKKILKAARTYMAKVPGAEAGNHGHDATLKAANVLAVKFALTVAEALPIFAEWNQTCAPPWPESELLRKLDEALKKPHGEYGELRRREKENRAAGPKGKTGTLIESANAPSGEISGIAVEKVKAAELDPMATARDFASLNLTHNTTAGKELTLRRWQGEWHWWDHKKRRYVRVGDEMVRAQLRLYLEPIADSVSKSVVANMMGSLEAVLMLADSVAMPSWISDAGNADLQQFPAAEILATKSQLFHMPSLTEGEVHSQPATPRFFSSTSLDFEFNPIADPPVAWFDFLRQVWGEDYDSIECLQEWFGYLLSPDTSLQKILVIVGPRRSGKGTIGRVLRGLIGSDNMAAPTLAGLGTNFGLWPIYDKSVAVVSDARLSGRTDSAVVTERLLSISGEDAQTFDRKNMKPMTMKLPTRFVIMTNELPRLGDSSNALVGRFVVLRMHKSFYGQEDNGLTEKLLAELPGILLWSIEGWKRLRARGHFIQPETGKSLIRDMEAMASPVGEFVRDCCILGPSEETLRDKMYAAWRQWCAKNGKHETDQATFGRDLRASVPLLGDVVHRELGVRQRFYTGIALKTADQF